MLAAERHPLRATPRRGACSRRPSCPLLVWPFADRVPSAVELEAWLTEHERDALARLKRIEAHGNSYRDDEPQLLLAPGPLMLWNRHQDPVYCRVALTAQRFAGGWMSGPSLLSSDDPQLQRPRVSNYYASHDDAPGHRYFAHALDARNVSAPAGDWQPLEAKTDRDFTRAVAIAALRATCERTA